MKIFIITLPKEKRRQNHIQSIFDTKGVPFEFLFGVDGRELSQEEIYILYDAEKAKKYDGELSRGEIGCALSHRLAYEHMIKNNIEHALILEDDISIKDDFFVIIDLLEKIPTNSYVIKLDKFYSKQTGEDNSRHAHFTPWHRIMLNKEYNIRQPLHDPTLTWGYYIDIKAAYSLFNLSQKVFLPSDAWYYFKRFIKLRIINKSLINNNINFESIIGTHIIFHSGKNDCSQHKKKTTVRKKNSILFKKLKKAAELMAKIFF